MRSVGQASETGQLSEQVYLLQCRSSSLVKIGRSTNIQRRFADIQCMSPTELDLIWCTEGGAALEARLHRAFRIRRKHGEWFDFSGLDPVEAVKAFLAGEQLTPAPTAAGRSFEFRLGQVVEIIASDWPGPPLGRVTGISARPGAASHQYWLEDMALGSKRPSFAFLAGELRVTDPRSQRRAASWPWDVQGRSRFRSRKLIGFY